MDDDDEDDDDIGASFRDGESVCSVQFGAACGGGDAKYCIGQLVSAVRVMLTIHFSILRMPLVSWHECVIGWVRVEGNYRGWSPHPARSSPTFRDA